MADVPYDPFGWQNARAGGTPENAANLEAFGEHMHELAKQVAAGGVERGFLSVNAFTAITSTAAGGAVIAPAAMVLPAVPIGTRPVVVKLGFDGVTCAAALGGGFILRIDDVATGFMGVVAAGSSVVPFHRERRITGLSAGNHKFEIYGKTTNAASPLSASVGDGIGTNNSPGTLQVIEV